ncbi:MAG TPA: hypothetical protein VNH18_08180, partial [Bryobacteraceae bacterium]|nr:hypothetical protein [Bryobacteraceae bacterium]
MTETISAKDYVAGNGVSLDTIGLQKAISALRGGSPSAVATIAPALFIPALGQGGCYRTDQTIVIEAFTGPDIYGSGWGSCIEWVGGPTGPIIHLKGNYHLTLRNLRIQNAVGHPVDTAVEITHGENTGAAATSQHDLIENIWIRSPDGTIEKPILVDATNSGFRIDGNNDYHQFRDVLITGYPDTAVTLVGSQSYSHQFFNCLFLGYYSHNGVQHRAHVAVKALSISAYAGGASGGAPSFSWHGGGTAGHDQYSFYIDGYSDAPNVIEGFDSEEDGANLLYSVNNYGSNVLENFRWTTNDRRASTDFIHQNGGKLTIRNARPGARTTGGIEVPITLWYEPANSTISLPAVRLSGLDLPATYTDLSQVMTGAYNPSTYLDYEDFSWRALEWPFHSPLWSGGTLTVTVAGTTPEMNGDLFFAFSAPATYDGVKACRVASPTTLKCVQASDPGPLIRAGSIFSNSAMRGRYGNVRRYSPSAHIETLGTGKVEITSAADNVAHPVIDIGDSSKGTVLRERMSEAVAANLAVANRATTTVGAISGAAWSRGVATYTIASTATLRTGDLMRVHGMYPPNYAVDRAICTVVDAMHFSCPLKDDPRAEYIRGGTADRIEYSNMFEFDGGFGTRFVPTKFSALSGSPAGALRWVTDINTTTVGEIVSGGGTAGGFVAADGSNWRLVWAPGTERISASCSFTPKTSTLSNLC